MLLSRGPRAPRRSSSVCEPGATPAPARPRASGGAASPGGWGHGEDWRNAGGPAARRVPRAGGVGGTGGTRGTRRRGESRGRGGVLEERWGPRVWGDAGGLRGRAGLIARVCGGTTAGALKSKVLSSCGSVASAGVWPAGSPHGLRGHGSCVVTRCCCDLSRRVCRALGHPGRSRRSSGGGGVRWEGIGLNDRCRGLDPSVEGLFCPNCCGRVLKGRWGGPFHRSGLDFDVVHK